MSINLDLLIKNIHYLTYTKYVELMEESSIENKKILYQYLYIIGFMKTTVNCLAVSECSMEYYKQSQEHRTKWMIFILNALFNGIPLHIVKQIVNDNDDIFHRLILDFSVVNDFIQEAKNSKLSLDNFMKQIKELIIKEIPNYSEDIEWD
jgi:hypothetical protein